MRVYGRLDQDFDGHDADSNPPQVSHRVGFSPPNEARHPAYLGLRIASDLVEESTRGDGAIRGLRAAKFLRAEPKRDVPPTSVYGPNPILRFDTVVAVHTEHFVGRREGIASIERFIEERPAPTGLVTAAPGLGKSALLGHFYREHGGRASADGWVFHFAVHGEQRDQTLLGLRSLVAQAELQSGRNTAARARHRPLPWNYAEIVQRLNGSLMELGVVMGKRGRGAVIVLDGIMLDGIGLDGNGLDGNGPDGNGPDGNRPNGMDELSPHPSGTRETIFGAIPEVLPDNVVCILFLRRASDGSPVGEEAGGVGFPRGRPIPGVAPLPGLASEDVRELVRDRLGEDRPDLRDAPKAVLDRICLAAQRSADDASLDLLFLSLLAEGAREGTIDLSRPDNVPAGLGDLIDTRWRSLDPSRDYLLHRLLGMLAEMEGYGSDALFALALGTPEDEVTRLRRRVNDLLMPCGACRGDAQYALLHDRLRGYVQRKFSPRDRAKLLHEPLLQACRSWRGATQHYAARYTTYHQRALALHEGLTLEERASFAEELWATVHDDSFLERGFALLRDEQAVTVDFARTFEVFRPRPEHGDFDKRRRAVRLTLLADRSLRAIAKISNLALARVHDFAREGDAVQVIRLAEREPSIALRWMLLLRAAASMRTVNLDPTWLFESILATGDATLHWQDLVNFERLLAACDAPEAVRDHIRRYVPDKPDPLAEVRDRRADPRRVDPARPSGPGWTTDEVDGGAHGNLDDRFQAGVERP